MSRAFTALPLENILAKEKKQKQKKNGQASRDTKPPSIAPINHHHHDSRNAHREHEPAASGGGGGGGGGGGANIGRDSPHERNLLGRRSEVEIVGERGESSPQSSIVARRCSSRSDRFGGACSRVGEGSGRTDGRAGGRRLPARVCAPVCGGGGSGRGSGAGGGGSFSRVVEGRGAQPNERMSRVESRSALLCSAGALYIYADVRVYYTRR
jgi:hypothetical protein